MSFDNLCKLIAEKHPQRFAEWILGKVNDEFEILKTELSIEPIRADSVTFLRNADCILHLEFQTIWPIKPPMPLRMLDYWVRLYRLYQVPVHQVVIVLLPPTDESVIQDFFAVGNTYHRFQVIKLCVQDPEIFLQDPVLLPFASLAKTENPDFLLSQISQQVQRIALPDDRQELSAYVQLIAGLKYDKATLRSIFQEETMQESVIYQEIAQKNEQRGRLTEGKTFLLRLLAKRVGVVPPEAMSQIDGLSLEQLETLGEATLDFRSLTDLTNWLQQ